MSGAGAVAITCLAGAIGNQVVCQVIDSALFSMDVRLCKCNTDCLDFIDLSLPGGKELTSLSNRSESLPRAVLFDNGPGHDG